MTAKKRTSGSALVTWPHPVLTMKCAEVKLDTQHHRGLVFAVAFRMVKTMYACKGGGLAAPQIGYPWRLFAMNSTGDKGQPQHERVCINPVIVSASAEQQVGTEGCLSIPGVEVAVSRAQRIVLRYQDLWANHHQITMVGFEARIAQHEMDHLDGKLIVAKEQLPPDHRTEQEILALEMSAMQRGML